MNFLLDEHQLEMQRSVSGFLAKEYPATRLHQIFDQEDPYDADLWRSLVELGLPALLIPEAYGGMGLEMIDLAVVCEVLGRHGAPQPLLGHVLTALAIAQGGSEQQKQQWLPKLASGEVLATIAWNDGQAGWLPQQWQIAVADTISGEKTCVPHAMQADMFLVGLAGGQLGLVDARAAGVSRTAADSLDRTRPLGQVHFADAPVELLPEGVSVAERVCDAALILLAADAFGGASQCVTMAVDYAKIREQFDQPIGKFQAVKHQLATMATEIEPARGLYWFAAHAFDHKPEESARAAALAKAHLCDRYLQVARDTVEVHGGIGYTWECDVQFYVKRAMFDYAFCGAPGLHLDRAAILAGW